jgi:serine/threonine protein kinase
MHNLSVLHDGKRGIDHESQAYEQDDSLTQDTEPSPTLDTSEGAPSPMLDDTASSSVSARSVIEIDVSDDGSIAQPTSPSPPSPLARSYTPVNGVLPPPVDHVVDPVLSTPPPSRIPRSQSADPDKAARLSRIYTPSATSVGISGTETTSASASATEDDSPLNPLRERRKRKKRSASRAKDRDSRKVLVSDFEMMRVLGKGCAGKVLLVRHKSSSDLYALKAITKRHVLAHQELQHTLTEQAVLRRMAAEGSDPFVVKLWWSFHDKENLFLVMDFHPGGDLATQLARWGRLGRDRARFYAAEIVEGVEGLHNAGVVYRDLKPENILIAADGHIVLTDFGLSKEFPRRSAPYPTPGTSPISGSPHWMKDDKDLATPWPPRHADTTSTFCGTAEYLAPEVIQGLPYSYEVDWWSFGTMLYEMLTGITPFWADNHSDMYVRVLQDELQFPDERAMDQDTKSLIRGLLQRNPALRITEPRIKRHPYFSMIDWSHVYYKRYIPPYIPPIDPSNASDTQNFDETFLDMEPVINDENDLDTDQEREQTDQEPTDGEDSVATPSQSRSSSAHPPNDLADVFDGYSFKGRNSILLDDEDVSEEEEDVEEEQDRDVTGHSISVSVELNGIVTAVTVAPDHDEPTPEPKTPEARPAALPPTTPPAKQSPKTHKPELPPVDTTMKPALVTDATPRASEDIPAPASKPPISPVKATAQAAAAASSGPDIHRKEPKKAPGPKLHGQRSSRQRNRREKSGIPELDGDTNDEDDVRTTHDEGEDDWDIIEADGEDRNGVRGPSLFARGYVDKYRLAVFRKVSTPNRTGTGEAVGGPSSPSPTAKVRRGRAPALAFRRTPKNFLRPKSPPSSRSSKSPAKLLSMTDNRTSATLSTVSSPQSVRTTLGQPSLKSKDSTASVGSPDSSSGASTNGDARAVSDVDVIETVRLSHVQADEDEKHHHKSSKKAKRGAGKMLSLFGSPR